MSNFIAAELAVAQKMSTKFDKISTRRLGLEPTVLLIQGE
jgi:hypothetical protein